MPRATTKKQAPEQAFADCRAAGQRARERHGIGQPVREIALFDRPLSWWRERWNDEYRQLFIESYVKIRDPRQKNKLVLMRFNRMQADLHKECTGKDCCLKMRRGGMSMYWLARFFADAVVLSGQSVRIVPHTPKAEAKLFRDLKTMYRNLPEHIRPATLSFSKELIHFYDPAKGTLDSTIDTQSVQPGHEESGRAEGFTHLHLTEVPFWRGDALTAALALVEAAEYGQIVMESTAKGVDYFHQIYQQGKKKEAGWKAHFYQWYWRDDLRKAGARFEIVDVGERAEVALLLPGETLDRDDAAAVARAVLSKRERAIAMRIFRFLRQQKETTGRGFDWEWDNDVAERIAWRRSKVQQLGERKFLIEYPENDTECFAATGRPVIGSQYWKVTCSFREPEPGGEYLIAVDSSNGLEDGDFAAIQVIDLVTGRQCHEVEERWTPDVLAEAVAKLSDRYNYAAIVAERNGPGLATIICLQKKGYGERLYKHLDAKLRRQVEDGLTIDEAKEKAEAGFPTSVENKALMGYQFEEAVRTGSFGVASLRLVEQFKTTVWGEKDKWGAKAGYHDDLMMAAAIGNYVRLYETDMLPVAVPVLPEFGSTVG